MSLQTRARRLQLDGTYRCWITITNDANHSRCWIAGILEFDVLVRPAAHVDWMLFGDFWLVAAIELHS
jgi:hypothetical protein